MRDMIARKTCSACGKSLSAAAFNSSAQTTDGLAQRCRACTNAGRRQRDRSRQPQRDSVGQSARLAKALRQGDLKAVRNLLRGGAKPCWDWVCETMRGGHLALAECLLKSGAERNVFTLAAMGDVAGLRRRLGRAPADAERTASLPPASIGVTALHVACASDWSSHGAGRMQVQIQVAQILKDCGADVNATAQYRGINDATPLFSACWSSGNLQLVRWLLDQGARAVDRDLAAALGHFQRHGREAYEIAEALLAWGVPVDGSVPGDRTPLQAFAHQGVHRTVGWLLAHGADVNARGPGGRTAAHFAAERNTGPRTLAVLVEYGADLNACDEDGHQPLDIAMQHEKVRLVEWIRRRVGVHG